MHSRSIWCNFMARTTAPCRLPIGARARGAKRLSFSYANRPAVRLPDGDEMVRPGTTDRLAGGEPTGEGAAGEGKADEGPDGARKFAHDARQSLNAIRLTCGNMRARLLSRLDPELAEWCLGKLDKIDAQVDRLADLVDPASRDISPAGRQP